MFADTILAAHALFTGLGDAALPGAVAISEGRIVKVGTLGALSELKGPATEVRDFGEACIVPGFHDSHLHFFHSALYGSPLAARFCGTSEADCVERLAALADRRPGGWLLAQGWREYLWDPPLLPTKHSLDRAFPTRPAALYSGDAHTLWVNSAALRALGITPASVPPAGGSYGRDGSGELTGIIRESAAMELMGRIASSFPDSDIQAAYRAFLGRLAAQGITSVCDLSLMAHEGLDFVRDDIFAALEGKGRLTARVHLFPTLLAGDGRLPSLQKRLTGPLLRACGYKQFFDGVSSQHTAYLARPYANARFPKERGAPLIPVGTMRTLVLSAASEGFPVRIHTIGDEAIHCALDIFEEAQARFGAPAGAHHCLEHAEIFPPDDRERLARLGVIAAVQPPHITLGPDGAERDLGLGRIRFLWPFASLLDAGACLAFGSDSPVSRTDPMDVLYAATLRQDPQTHGPDGGWLPSERITMAQAVRAYTLGSARAAGRSDELGTLEAGKLADIAVLDRNPLALAPEAVQTLRVQATYVGGRCVYDGDQKSHI